MKPLGNGNTSRITEPLEQNPLVTGGFLSQKVCDADVWCFLWCQPVQIAEQTVDRQVN